MRVVCMPSSSPSSSSAPLEVCGSPTSARNARALASALALARAFASALCLASISSAAAGDIAGATYAVCTFFANCFSAFSSNTSLVCSGGGVGSGAGVGGAGVGGAGVGGAGVGGTGVGGTHTGVGIGVSGTGVGLGSRLSSSSKCLAPLLLWTTARLIGLTNWYVGGGVG